MNLLEKYNKASSPVVYLRFPAFNPTDEEVKRLLSTLSYVVKSFNEKNTTPLEVDIMELHDICPRSITFSGPDE